MILFICAAAAVNLAVLALLVLARHRIARWPAPGLWWLAAIVLAIVLTLKSGEVLLP